MPQERRLSWVPAVFCQNATHLRPNVTGGLGGLVKTEAHFLPKLDDLPAPFRIGLLAPVFSLPFGESYPLPLPFLAGNVILAGHRSHEVDEHLVDRLKDRLDDRITVEGSSRIQCQIGRRHVQADDAQLLVLERALSAVQSSLLRWVRRSICSTSKTSLG